jgi:hypothetical protein
MVGPPSPEGKDGPLLRAADRNRRQGERDRASELDFVKAVVPLLDAEARERALAVRVRPGDPAAAAFFA